MVNFRYYFLVFLSMTISGCLDNAECTILAVFTLLLYVAILVKISKFQLFMFLYILSVSNIVSFVLGIDGVETESASNNRLALPTAKVGIDFVDRCMVLPIVL
ncbi:MAG: hypothetical protein IKY22_03365 [Bacteroidales bacterium]|nr:hypothetical protein [Bacteroidales bacterium]